jgi:hypothetical protein
MRGLTFKCLRIRDGRATYVFWMGSMRTRVLLLKGLCGACHGKAGTLCKEGVPPVAGATVNSMSSIPAWSATGRLPKSIPS